jgi:NAD(P)-dependent dehydrogenase (short-subunit alcohol dehydrogenase family)
MSKRGLTAYSDALRLEHGDAITVTTVYPGYIRTPIHRESEAAGLGLEGSVPVERVEDAARALARAALGPPARDLATTRSGAIGYTLMRHIPRRLLDAVRAAPADAARRGRALRPVAPQAPGFATMRKIASSTSTPASAPNIPWRRAWR